MAARPTVTVRATTGCARWIMDGITIATESGTG
jgi:hypothetical protein